MQFLYITQYFVYNYISVETVSAIKFLKISFLEIFSYTVIILSPYWSIMGNIKSIIGEILRNYKKHFGA